MVQDIKETTELIIKNLGVLEVSVNVSQNNDTILINIESPEEHSLIGRDNDRFDALSHIVKRIVAKKHGEDTKVVLDVNGVLRKRDEHLKHKASMMAERARAFKINVELDPMSSYERMIVHSHLEGAPNIKTESIGEGKDRRLVIKYIGGTSDTI